MPPIPPPIPPPMTAQDLAWFEAGEAVYAGEPSRFPPIDDARAQRWWLGGFASAWAGAAPQGDAPAQQVDTAEALGSDDLRAALALALAEHPRLAAVLFAQIPAPDSAGLH